MTPSNNLALSVVGAFKRYGQVRALNGLELELPCGEWVGLIGPNGAGKTTAMLAIAGLLPIDQGEIQVLGRTLDGPRPEEIGWVPQGIALYQQLTARENLEVFGRLHGVAKNALAERAAWALDWTGLEHRADDRVGTFSGGMQRRLNIACAVLHNPSLLLLDEPTVGVDPQARARIFDMLATLRDDGITLLHSSHQLDDIEHTCDTLNILDGGRRVAFGTVQGLLRQFAGSQSRLTLEGRDIPREVDGLVYQSGDRFQAALHDVGTELPKILAAVLEQGGQIERLRLDQPSLEDIFLRLTGKDLRE